MKTTGILLLGLLVAVLTSAGGDSGIENPEEFWERGFRVTDLGTLGGEHSRALAINNQGQVVGYAKTAIGSVHAFL